MLGSWEVTFKNLSTGTIGNDRFTANDKREVGECFRACYRHDSYKILDVKLIKTYEEEDLY